MADRPLPQSLDAERGLLGILMERNDTLFEVVHLLRKDDFIEPWHGEVYTLIRDMIETGREAKPVTLIHDLSQDRDIGNIKASEYLALLLADAPAQTMARTFARTVADLALRRRLIAVAEEHVKEAYEAPATITAQEIEARYGAQSAALFSTVQEAGMQTLGDVGKTGLRDLQKALRGGRSLGLSSGLKVLDDLWGTLLPGLYGVAGASGSGKTALAWQIARYLEAAQATTEPVPALFCSLEMKARELWARDLTFLTGIAGDRIARADLNEEEFAILTEAYKLQRNAAIVIDDRKGQTAGHIRGAAMRLKRLRGLSAIFIDHWSYIKASSRNPDQYERQRDDLRALNTVADDLEVPVILLAQLKASYGAEMATTRPGQEPKVRPPNVGDIANGAVFEQECDAMILAHREDYILGRMKPSEGAGHEVKALWAQALERAKGKAQLILNKRRDGAGFGIRTVGFDGKNTRFLEKPLPPPDLMSQINADMMIEP